jgi:hypothetical protein
MNKSYNYPNKKEGRWSFRNKPPYLLETARSADQALRGKNKTLFFLKKIKLKSKLLI